MRARILEKLVNIAMRRRRLVLWTSLAVTLVLGAASARLTMDVRWSTLLPETMPVVAEYKKIDRSYLQPANMIVAVSGPDRGRLEQITDEVVAVLERELVCEPGATAAEAKASGRLARHVYGAVPEEWLTEHALRLLKPDDAERAARRLRDPRLLPFLFHLNDDLEREFSDADNVRTKEREIVATLDAVERLMEAVEDAAEGRLADGEVAATARDLTIGNPYMLSLDRGMSLILIASAIPGDDFETTPQIDRRIESLLEPLQRAHPDYTFERTGLTAIGRDELDSVGPQTLAITGVAMLLVFGMLVWNYRSVTVPVLAVTPLAVGIVWTVGLIALTLGQMNLFTSMIMVVLIGLGIDFSIHVTNRFTEELTARGSLAEALRLAVGETGVAVTTGAVTTAVAFFMLMIADTRGIREFGFCAGSGVLVTLVAVLWTLPALLAWRAEALQRRDRPASRDFARLGSVAVWAGRHRWVVIAVIGALTAAGAGLSSRLAMEWNFMNLEPEGLRSVELQDEIVDRFRLSTTASMLTVATVEESRRLRDEFKDRRLVGDVDDISMWVSRTDLGESLPHIRELRGEIARPRPHCAFIAATADPEGTGDEVAGLSTLERRQRLVDEIDRLWANMVEIQALSITGGQDRVADKTTRLVGRRETRDQGFLIGLIDDLAAADESAWQGVDRLAAGFAAVLGPRVARMAAGETPVIVSMVPEATTARYVSTTESAYLMSILPKRNLYERADLERFREMATRIDHSVTGTPQMILEMNLATVREGRVAFLAALVVIFVVLLVDFRRPLVAALCLLPLLGGAALTFGVLWLLGEKINYINLIAFPVILGIGVDDGVHLLHRLRREGRGGLRRAVASVGHAMVMSSLTTMIGFGSLMLYLMRGMASMGLLLFVGVGACLVVTLTLLPAVATLFEERIVAPRTSARERLARSGASTTGALLLGALLLVGTVPDAHAQDARAAEILRACDEAEGYRSSYAEMRQVITTSSGGSRTLVLRSWAVNDGDRQLAEYLAPADIEGQRLLMTNDGDDIWMYNAETRRTRKLGSHMKRKRVMGTDFTYEDQAGGKVSEKYTGVLLGEEGQGGVTCFKLELKPTPQGPSYPRVVAWIAKEDFITRRVDFYRDATGEPFKRMVCADVRDVDGKRVAFDMVMTNLEDGTETINELTGIRYGMDIPDAVFESRNLGR